MNCVSERNRKNINFFLNEYLKWVHGDWRSTKTSLPSDIIMKCIDMICVKNYYRTGELKSCCILVNGKKHGVCIQWFSDGKMGSYTEYNEGKKHGKCRIWASPYMGKRYLFISCHYNNGHLHGMYRQWKQNSLEFRGVYVYDRLHGEITIGCIKEMWNNGVRMV